MFILSSFYTSSIWLISSTILVSPHAPILISLLSYLKSFFPPFLGFLELLYQSRGLFNLLAYLFPILILILIVYLIVLPQLYVLTSTSWFNIFSNIFLNSFTILSLSVRVPSFFIFKVIFGLYNNITVKKKIYFVLIILFLNCVWNFTSLLSILDCLYLHKNFWMINVK